MNTLLTVLTAAAAVTAIGAMVTCLVTAAAVAWLTFRGKR